MSNDPNDLSAFFDSAADSYETTASDLKYAAPAWLVQRCTTERINSTMKQAWYLLLIGLFVSLSGWSMRQGSEAVTAHSRKSLRSLASAQNFHIGAAVSVSALSQDSTYANILAREFNMLTPENAMKFDALHPEKTRYTFKLADGIVSFAARNKMTVRGHTLVWHEQLPGWLTAKEWTREELIQILRDHIYTVVRHYRGHVAAWDVVNEAIDNLGTFRKSIWLRVIGPEYIELAFKWAHEADPGASLFYSDYGGEGMSEKANKIYALIDGMVKRGIPVHGVGLHLHVGVEHHPEPEEIAKNISRYADLGLQVHITEMDVRIKGDATPTTLSKQARLFQAVTNACVSHRNCTAIVLWGFTDRYSWIPSFFPGWGNALIFDRDYHPKPSYEALYRVLEERYAR